MQKSPLMTLVKTCATCDSPGIGWSAGYLWLEAKRKKSSLWWSCHCVPYNALPICSYMIQGTYITRQTGFFSFPRCGSANQKIGSGLFAMWSEQFRFGMREGGGDEGLMYHREWYSIYIESPLNESFVCLRKKLPAMRVDSKIWMCATLSCLSLLRVMWSIASVFVLFPWLGFACRSRFSL